MTRTKPQARKKRVGSYPYTNVVFSITTALFMIGLFSLFAISANRLTTKLRNDIEIKVFLINGLEQAVKDEIQGTLAQRPYLDRDADGPRVRYLGKDEAARQMIQDNGENFVEFLGENPLRDAFIINITEQQSSPERMAEIQKELEKVAGVFEVYYPKEQVAEINVNIQRIGAVIGLFVILLMATVVILINNSIKLALFSQRFLIRSMQLVGATPFFIKRPFLVRAMLHGISGGLIASLLLALLQAVLLRQFSYFGAILLYQDALAVYAGLLLIGGLIGYFSAYTSVSRYLRMRLDELY
jgi:cell division transport system permease protein